ncbi:aminopeptidase P family protein [Tropicimonas sp. IMCC6043]|nr:aminopeptidase P family protein [Tropicimonas sp. IMCC6043]
MDRGFSEAELRGRVRLAQARMALAGIDALLLTTEPEIRYFTGFLSDFWLSPTRPWYVVLPGSGEPVAIIPDIGKAAFACTWLSDVRTWPSPDPDAEGVPFVCDAIREVVGEAGVIGIPMGQESHLRMPIEKFLWLRETLSGFAFRDCTEIVKSLRMVKSGAEVAKIESAARAAGAAFGALTRTTTENDSERDLFRRFKIACLEAGADDVPYLVGGTGTGGYDDIISPPSGHRLRRGEVLLLDVGARFDGYFCDFDRNFSVGPPSREVADAYTRLREAVEAGFVAARPGATARDVFLAIHTAIDRGGGSPLPTGRYGHGLGMQLTEWPSLSATDATMLEDGMVLTLEPCLSLAPGRYLVHEEIILVSETRNRYLTKPAPDDIPEIRLVRN